MKMAEGYPNRQKTLREKEKLLITISPFLTVFKRLVLQTSKNQGVFGKGLSHIFRGHGSFMSRVNILLSLKCISVSVTII